MRHAAASQPPAANTHLMFSLLQTVHPFVLFLWRQPGDTREMVPSPMTRLLSQLRLFFSMTKRCSQAIFSDLFSFLLLPFSILQTRLYPSHTALPRTGGNGRRRPHHFQRKQSNSSLPRAQDTSNSASQDNMCHIAPRCWSVFSLST